MSHIAEHVWINLVDNGFVVTLRAHGTDDVMLVARGQDELFGILADVDWIGPLRQLPPDAGPTAPETAVERPSLGSSMRLRL